MKKIVLVGGGTMGSVTPLVALARELQARPLTPEHSDGGRAAKNQWQFFWFGTFRGVERAYLKNTSDFLYIPVVSAKLRRYFDLRVLLLPFALLFGFLESLLLLVFIRPALLVATGSFVQVPVAVAAWILRIPVLIHQQDVRPGLANQLAAPFATKISAVFSETAKFFPNHKTVLAKNPLRNDITKASDTRAKKFFNLESNVPTVVVLGGSTGALSLNEQIQTILPKILEVAQVIHITGRGKLTKFVNPRYKPYEFLNIEIFDALAVADVVVSRAGLGALSELAYFGTPAILVPMRGTHQEDNAKYACERGAAICLDRDDVSILEEKIHGLLFNTEKRMELSKNIRALFISDKSLVQVVLDMLG